MAIPSDTVWEVQSTASDNNGGGWSVSNKGATGVDMSQGAPVTFTSTLSAAGTSTLTDSAAGFTNTMLGNVINISGQGFFCITGFTNASTVTVDHSMGTFSTTSGVVGGPLATPGKACTVMTGSNVMWVKATATYSITSAATGSGGVVSLPTNSTKMLGYTTTRGDGGRPTLQASGIATFTLVTASSSSQVENIIVDGAGLTSSRGFSLSNARAYNCKAMNCTNGGFNLGVLVFCEAATCSGAGTGGFQGSPNAWRCYSHDHTSTCNGFINCAAMECIAYNCNGSGFSDPAGSMNCVDCISYGNAVDGFRFNSGAGNASCAIQNCIAYGNTGFGVRGPAAESGRTAYSIFLGSNTAGATTGTITIVGQTNLTADPFTNAAGGDFSLNTTTGGGAAVRGAGIPGTFPGLSTTGFRDGGAVQHQDTGGGGGAGSSPHTVLGGMPFIG